MKPQAIPKVKISRQRKAQYAEARHVYFADEAPRRIGSGWRWVTVAKVGRKWAKVVEVATGRSARLRLSDWRRMSP